MSPARAAALCAALVATASVAEAAPSRRPLVLLRVESCVEAERAEVARLLRIELQTPVVLDGSVGGPESATRVQIVCEGALHRLDVADALTRKSLSRTLDLRAAAARVRPRLLALAIAEFVTLSWMELEAFPRSAAPVADSALPARAEEVAAARAIARERLGRLDEPALSVDAFLGSTAFFRGTGQLWGGGARLTRARAPFGVALDVAGAFGGGGLSVGRSSTALASGGVAALLRGRAGALTGGAAAGVRGGVARLVGATEQPGLVADALVGPYGGPFLALSAEVALVRRLHASLRAEGGWAVARVVGAVNGRAEASVAGPWIGLELAMGVGR